ncbi:MAG: PAS domain-containing sensor histidine kinase [Alphaproteobacteria bacterium]|nr:PAS domain-containing sensor histidine kinase [Alphaproteobacteria bacterium]
MTEVSNATSKNKIGKYFAWSEASGLSRKIAIFLAIAAILSGIATLASMSGSGPTGPNPKIVMVFLYLDIILMVGLGAVILKRFFTVRAAWKKGRAGSKLHTRFIVLFSLVAVTPAIIVAIFAALFLNFGIQSWFNERVSTALTESGKVAKAYLLEHQKNIKTDVLSVAADLNKNAALLLRNKRQFNLFLNTQSALRGLPDIMVVDANRRIVARSDLSFSLEFEYLPLEIIRQADLGEVVTIRNDNVDKVRAILKLTRFVDAYLIVGRFVDPKVLEYIENTEGAVAEYKNLEKRKKGIQVTFVMIFSLVAFLLLLASAWFGLIFATRLATPISNLIEAAEKVRRGDMSARVENSADDDEIGTLSRAFNRMTSQLEAQRMGLVEANKELDERHRFTETVLSGVSAGVIGLDPKGGITLPNRSASLLLHTDLEERIGEPLIKAVPEMAKLVIATIERPDRLSQGEIHLIREGQSKVLLVRVAAETRDTEILGYVMTFDDITELQSAQRTAAWADIARRIAHEIKNPLTPIQLSAERLKRKYLKEINSDPETFNLCVQTITRHVEDIGQMIDEFTSFARMPQPKINLHNLSETCREAIFLEKNRHPDIEFKAEIPVEEILVQCDEKQIGRALTNILKNAAESVSSAMKVSENIDAGQVSIVLAKLENKIKVTIDDNGFGFPPELKDRLTEPYVTSRAKGTGLGLAIVKKIMEEHGGELILSNNETGGARVELIFHELDEDALKELKTDKKFSTKSPMDVATSLVTDGL